jgi:hypothetical protein
MLNVIMLSVIMLSVIMLSVIMLSVIMLSAIMLSVIMLSVIMLNVIAPWKHVSLSYQGIKHMAKEFNLLGPDGDVFILNSREKSKY